MTPLADWARQAAVEEVKARLSELHGRLKESERLRPDLIRQRGDNLLERPPPRPDDDNPDEPPGGSREP